jgi:hypothetical protein
MDKLHPKFLSNYGLFKELFQLLIKCISSEKPSKFVKNTRLRLILSTLPRCLEIRRATLTCT